MAKGSQLLTFCKGNHLDTGTPKLYKLLDADGVIREYPNKGTFGGYRKGKTRLYGRLDCKSAKRFIAMGHYVKYRVFFADERSAIAAGHRPCGKCMPAEHAAWKSLP